MASADAHFLLVSRALATWLETEHELRIAPGDWVRSDEPTEALSRRFSTTGVRWQTSTVTSLTWLEAWTRGKHVRTVRHDAESGWFIEGRVLPFERTARLLTRRKVDAHELLEAFLGAPTGDLPYAWFAEQPRNVSVERQFELAVARKQTRRWATLAPTLRESRAGRAVLRRCLNPLVADAAVADDFPLVEALLSAGASPDARNGDGSAALHLSLSAEMITRFVAARADLEVRDARGLTPVRCAARQPNFLAMARMNALLDHGAKADARLLQAIPSFEDSPARRRVAALLRSVHERLGSSKPWRPTQVELLGTLVPATPAGVRRFIRAETEGLDPEDPLVRDCLKEVRRSLLRRPEVKHLAP